MQIKTYLPLRASDPGLLEDSRWCNSVCATRGNEFRPYFGGGIYMAQDLDPRDYGV